jgi:hypothetical protein
VKRAAQAGLYLPVTHVYDGGADDFDPDKCVREAVEDGDLVAAATIAMESYGWHLYGFIVRQVAPDEVDEVFTRVADEMLRGLPELVRGRVRDWIYTLVHGAWIRTQAGDPRLPLEKEPAFARWVKQLVAGFRMANGLNVRARRDTLSPQPTLVVLPGGNGLPRQLNAMIDRSPKIGPQAAQRIGMERVAMQRIR